MEVRSMTHHDFYIWKLKQISIVTSSGEMFNQLRRAVQQHNLRWKGYEKMPSIAKKRLFRKKFTRLYFCSNQKLASTQTLGSTFLEIIRKI